MLVEGEVHATKHVEIVEALVQPLDPDRFGHATAPTCRCRRCRSSIQSVNRVIGIVTTTKHNAAPSNGVKLNVAALAIWAVRNASGMNPETKAINAVSF